MTPTIHTFTGNLLWERTLEYPAWAPGKTQRAHTDSFQVGGKGINVSRMLARLNAPTEAFCFTGGSTGQDCLAWLQSRRLPVRAFTSRGATRIGVVVRSPQQPETTFLSPDVPPDASAWAAAAAGIRSLPAGSILALCGSFPGWASPEAEPFRTAISEFSLRAALVVDSYGPPLAWALTQPVALIKINRDEFDALAPASSPDASFAAHLEARARSADARAWIVTDGAEPVWLAPAGGSPRSLLPPKIEMCSPTGSGDVLLACLLHAHFQKGLPLEEALAFALPYASANAAHPGIADFDLNHLPR